jgi:hypothetical protein
MIKYLRNSLLIPMFLLSFAAVPRSQTPFVTDDAEVADKRTFHFEFIAEFDSLQKSAYPAKRQNTSISRLSYGIAKNIEVGVDIPVVTVFNARGTSPRHSIGISDVAAHIKIKLRDETKGSRLPALGAAFSIMVPTGDYARSLGSGVANYQVYGIAQKSLTKNTTVRANAGIYIAGNTVIGELGVRTASGKLFSGGVSVVKEYSGKLKLGAELTGVASGDFHLSKGQLQSILGGNYTLKKDLSLDFGFVVGHFPASPRFGFLIGFSRDF